MGFGGLLTVIVVLWCRWGSPTDAIAEHPISRAQTALGRNEYDLAEELASRIERDDESWRLGRLVAGEAAFRAGRFETAIEYYGSIPRDGSQTAVLAAFSRGEVSRHIGRLSDAEREYAYVLEHQPANGAARERMAFLLGVTGRRWESLPHFMSLVRNGHWDLDSLVLLGDLENPMDQDEYLRRCAEYAPNDVLVKSGLAAHAVARGRSSEARRLLREVVARAPHLVAAQAMLGELLVDADDETFVEWHTGLPPAADDYADTWFVRGLWARRRGRLRVAARCFWEAVRLAPAHRRATYQLGQVLVSLNATSGREFAERSRQQYELSQALDNVLKSGGKHEASVKRVAELMEDMGRMWEALAWASMASQMFPPATWPRSHVRRLSALLNDEVPRTLDSANLALKYDLSEFPNQEDLLRQVEGGKRRHPASQIRSSIRFLEDDGAGVDFVYYNGPDPSTKGVRMFEQTGGGIAVLDFDGDEWPDLYFTQGTQWKHGALAPTTSNRYTDRMYRNSGGSFVDVTLKTGLGNRGFGQGCSVGDFDNDGFPDLYVANVGRNRLYQNNGDGTFSDVTGESDLDGDEWTSSCVVVDLNADRFPDLYDVNYLKGDGLYSILCDGHACSPKVFDGAPDHIHLSRRNGTFESVTDATRESNAKGLGVVAADLHVRGRPCLFVANDQVPNFLLRSSATDDLSGVRLQDDGFVSGLAYNEDGLAMACMGIAADDVDGDGRIDFFVTNFKDESNTLYLQDVTGLFVDATNAAGLRAPSWPFVGWGTQFLDADRDGEVDLVVANGHVDDYRSEGGQYHMRPQFFQNTGAGRFVELSPQDVGSFFKRKYLGRGLARLDWNRDGLMDFVVSNIGARASLLTNRSTGIGHFLNVRLHATATARDAIGSVVEVVTDQRRWSKQLVAGDGYMASNERVLQFGLGDATSVTNLRVNWPSGDTTTIRNLPVDVTIELVEGAAPGTLWRGSELDSLPPVAAWKDCPTGGVRSEECSVCDR